MADRRGVGSEQGARAIGQRLAHIRKVRGLTQTDVAGQLGLAQSVYSTYESGDLRLHGELLLQLSSILKTSPNEILGFEESLPAITPLDRRLLKRLQKVETLSRRQQQALIRTIDEFLERTLG